ncbi:tumor suppressor, Mitostatin-domain-containing protein [Pelagophyceae sp. CCMP2097]|nr:tumor suppressor, Mitostatin-domain-containing protein [Pelagophyceae sp. CCMP2097]
MGDRKYRSKTSSNVDDTLFASKVRSTSRAPSNSIVISRAELEQTKAHSKIWTEADEAQRLADVEVQQETKLKAARDRKAKMLQLEENAKSKAKKSDIELDREGRKRIVRQLADKDVDENLDLVKMLNTLGARAAAFTIRDQQLEEKARREQRKHEYDERQDVLMEIDRLTDLKMRDEADTERRVKRIEDRKVIVEQIEARRRKKLLEEEQREQENRQMLALVAKYEDEDKAAAEKHRVTVIESRHEVMRANEAAIGRKETAKQRERDEEEAILLYQARSDEMMRKREEDEARVADAKKALQAKLLAQQERLANTQAAVDELRARRYAEERERRERQREEDEAKTKARRMGDLQQARVDQAAQKQRQAARDAILQEDEYASTLRLAHDVAERERSEAAARGSRAKEHRELLQGQISHAENSRTTTNRAKLEEGRKLKMEFAEERAKLEGIRDKMVSDMEKKGYNPRYLSEIRGCDIQKLQMR